MAATADLFENQKRVTVKAALRGKDFARPIAIQIELVDEINAREKRFRRWLISLELRKVRPHDRALLMGSWESLLNVAVGVNGVEMRMVSNINIGPEQFADRWEWKS